MWEHCYFEKCSASNRRKELEQSFGQREEKRSHCDTNTLAAVPHSPLLRSTSPTWKSIVRFLSASEGWTWFGALAWRRRVETMTMPSPGFLCRLPTMLLQRVRNSWGSSNPESSWMDSGNAPRRLLWLPLLRIALPGSDTSNMNSHLSLENYITRTFSRYWSNGYTPVLFYQVHRITQFDWVIKLI